VFTSILRQGRMAMVLVTASQVGFLDAFVDFNANGSCGDDGEKIFDSVPVAVGRYQCDAYNATPGGTVTFAHSTRTGSWPLPQCSSPNNGACAEAGNETSCRRVTCDASGSRNKLRHSDGLSLCNQ
jgi:hypothetical protein